MSHQTAGTISESISRFLSVKAQHKFLIRRSYDSWTWKQIFANRKHKLMTQVQKLDVEEHAKYGSDLAVSRFVLRVCPRGSIRNGKGIWIRDQRHLPTDFHKNFKLTAINAANGNLLTEGVDNFVGLDHLDSIDLSSNKLLDDFACDQLARQFRKSNTLREINLSYNPLISVFGLEVLFRIPSVKRIIALETQASNYENIDLFTLAAEDERQCQVFTLSDGRMYKSDELESLRWDKINVREIASQ